MDIQFNLNQFPLLSLDPSSTAIGWALVNAGPQYICSGAYLVPDTEPDERVRLAGRAAGEILRSLRLRPGAVLIEIPDFIGDRADSQKLITYFRACGSVEAHMDASGIPLILVRASGLRLSGRKQRYRDLFRQITGRHPIRDDESDALAQAWDYIQQPRPEPCLQL